ncbi:aspartic proteinase nepenthesin-2-like [Punica granatum]|uniref:Aspartic proteinase nepenthesin-2-like n=1 Tax=Punica granatum TaxID=22663 RepID=A0A6P8D6T8_PUNGR|nr:aspartic proteinase nepenthesin-2-like [Punica granatum]
MLGLGRCPLSFSTQLQYLYGNAFSYCLVDPNAGRNATSKLVFGSRQNLLGRQPMNFTSFVAKRPNPDETFYYLQIEPVSIIKEAFAKKVRGYPVVEDERFGLRYGASGKEELDMPEFRITFDDGAEWNFPAENVFIRFQPEGIVCLAILRIDNDRFSIIGNYQQKNFHVLYDAEESRLGFTAEMCRPLTYCLSINSLYLIFSPEVFFY